MCVLKKERPICLETWAFIDGSPHQRPSALKGQFGFGEGLAIYEVDYMHTIYNGL